MNYSTLILFFLILLTACIDNNDLLLNSTVPLEQNALILREAESRGYFLNTPEFPALLNSEDIYNEIENYNIIDVRPADHYNSGYINNSININHKDLYDYVSNLESDKPILLVSINGQASAYYTSLFRSYGIKNIYSLKFGIAGWNKLFEYEMINYIGNKSLGHSIFHSTNGKHYNLPEIIEDTASENIKDIFDQRIKNLFQEGFNEILSNKQIEDSQNDISSCSFGYLYSNINQNEIFVMASTTTDIKYNFPKPAGTIIFHPFNGINDFYSTEKLQTIPSDKIITCFSYSGQISAATVAYLRLLGYNAKSVLFGVQYYGYDAIKNTISTGRLYIYNSSNDFPIIKINNVQ